MDSDLLSISGRLERIENLVFDLQEHLRKVLPEQIQAATSADGQNRPRTRIDDIAVEKAPRSSSFRSSQEQEQSVRTESTILEEEHPERDRFAGVLPFSVLLDTVNVFFVYCHNQPYSFFHEGNFRQRLANDELPDHLLFAVLSSAIRFSTHPFFEGSLYEASITYANKSWKSIVASCFAANQVADIRTVQTITLLSIFDFTAGNSRHGSAWVKIGMAVRIAQDLRFMMEENSTRLSYADQEEQRRVFWSVYLLDRLVSCGRGRPPAILDASCQLQLPCDESSWRRGSWKKTLTLEQLSNRSLLPKYPDIYETGLSSTVRRPQLEGEQQGPFAHVVVMACTLGRAAQYMLQEFNIRNRDPPWDANSDFASLESDLLYLESHLGMGRPAMEIVSRCCAADGKIDQPSAGPIIFSHALFHLCHCLLNHPFLLRRRLESCHTAAPSSFLSRAFSSGWQHAQLLTRTLTDARKAGYIAQTSFYGYCAVVAGTIAALHIHSEHDGKRYESSVLLDENIRYLEEISGYWKNVSSMVFALKRFAEDTTHLNSLTSDNPDIMPLELSATDVMWSLVDYSTMSNAVQVAQVSSPDVSFWLDVNTSWYDLFGGVSTTNFGAHEVGSGPARPALHGNHNKELMADAPPVFFNIN